MNQANQNQAQAFNLVLEGVGYLNRVRLVSVKKGQPYLACTINAMKGMSDAVEYVSVDCIVVGKLATEIVNMLKADVDAKSKVFINFRAGDISPDFYEFPDRETREPVQREGLKARLLQITQAKVNGVKIDIPLVQRQSDAQPSPSSRDDEGVGSACEDIGSASNKALAEV